MSYMKARGSYAMGSAPSFGVSLSPIRPLDELRSETYDEMVFEPVDVDVPDKPSWLDIAKQKGRDLVSQVKPSKKPKEGTPTWQWLVLAGALGWIGWQIYKGK